MTLLQRLSESGAKRILALDGGGIRGALSLGYLKRIEDILRAKHNDPNLVLSDYFDLIGGTSTGAIIAAALAIGIDVNSIRALYQRLGGVVFDQQNILGGFLWPKFSNTNLERELTTVFGDMELGSDKIKTGLCIVTKRADTRSTWPLINHPNGKYFEPNRKILLRNALRASSAAPTYFAPEKLEVEPGQQGIFVDGGISMANNPALQLFLVATLNGFPFGWIPTPKDLMLVSVGTGFWSTKHSIEEVEKWGAVGQAKNIISMLMEDAAWHNQILLQLLGKTVTPFEIDSEIGDLFDDQLAGNNFFTYLRYDSRLDAEGLRDIGLGKYANFVNEMRELDASDMRDELDEIGRTAAMQQIQSDHFPDHFNRHK